MKGGVDEEDMGVQLRKRGTVYFLLMRDILG
jgi:hypothetical protein